MTRRPAWVRFALQSPGWQYNPMSVCARSGHWRGIRRRVDRVRCVPDEAHRSQSSVPTIVYHIVIDEMHYVIPPSSASGVRCTQSQSFRLKLREDRTLIYLVDTCAVVEARLEVLPAFTVVFTSQNLKDREAVRHWARQRMIGPKLFLPRWTEDELWALCRLVRPLAHESGSLRLPGLCLSPSARQRGVRGTRAHLRTSRSAYPGSAVHGRRSQRHSARATCPVLSHWCRRASLWKAKSARGCFITRWSAGRSRSARSCSPLHTSLTTSERTRSTTGILVHWRSSRGSRRMRSSLSCPLTCFAGMRTGCCRKVADTRCSGCRTRLLASREA